MISNYILLTLVGGTALSFLVADPPNRIHPVSWLGKLVSYFIPKLKHKSSLKKERLKGIVFTLTLAFGISVTSYYFSVALYELFGIFALLIYSFLVLKFTTAILTLERHVNEITIALREGNLIDARKKLSYIVGRKTEFLDREHIISATIESIGESLVDGIASPLFYYSLFGPSGAIAYRIINTLDSMIGYTDRYHYEIGWMAAKLDTISNYLPARLCGLLLVVSSKIVGADWKNSISVMHMDHNNTQSRNGGYPMSALAGALRVKLEKVGFYELGENIEPLSIEKCNNALKMVKVSVFLLLIFISIPMVLLLSLIGWWDILYGF